MSWNDCHSILQCWDPPSKIVFPRMSTSPHGVVQSSLSPSSQFFSTYVTPPRYQNIPHIKYISFELTDMLSLSQPCFRISFSIKRTYQGSFSILWNTRFHSCINVWIVVLRFQLFQDN